MEIDKVTLINALKKKFNKDIDDVIYEASELCGGTVGEVIKIEGYAISGNRIPFKLVLKTQNKWDRHLDFPCWRREYDIYLNKLDKSISRFIKLPECYLLEENHDKTKIWMEFVEGMSGEEDIDDKKLSLAAGKLGMLQADFHKSGNFDLPYIRSFPAVESSFDLWYKYTEEVLKKPISGFPNNIREILNQYAMNSNELLASFKTLPLTLCQGDVHHDNLIFRPDNSGFDIYLLDWDSAGYGYMGEDAIDMLLEAFLYTKRNVSLMNEYKRSILDSYFTGAGKSGFDYSIPDKTVTDLFAYSWGFRVASHYLYFKTDEQKRRCIDILNVMFNLEKKD
ncbi:MAG: aminoglycoside phosphotransferase family protein [Clostridia bacterium]|jgi:thiamine kinase-like enzyme